jgi:Spy/CpxP family protein refolding chaperone
MSKSRLSAGIYLALVFLSGALVGGLSYRLYSVNVSAVAGTSTNRPPSPEEFRRHYIEAISGKVHLDAQQVDQVNQILDETRAQFEQMNAQMRANGQAIRNQQREKITAILRDDQKPAYTEFQAEQKKIRDQMRAKQKK